MNSGTWFLRPRPAPGARLRLFCIAHAGGGASSFRGWADALPPEVEVRPVQLPGRENRIAEPPFDRHGPLVCALADVLAAEADPRPFALFGHSNGALLGFELARELRRRGAPLPVHLFATGRRAPHLPSGLPPIHHLPDEGFLAELRTLGGLPRTLMEHPELLELLLPALRADVAMHERYVCAEEEPLPFPITAFVGDADPRVSEEQALAWREHTSGAFHHRTFAGGHFFLHDDRAAFLRVLSGALRELPVG